MRRAGPWLLLMGFHVVLMLLWHSQDTHLPDGDEAGQLGAIYLWWTSFPDKGVVQTLVDAFTGPGDYPPAFAVCYALLYALLPVSAPFPTGLGVLLSLTSACTLLVTGLLAQRLARGVGEAPVPMSAPLVSLLAVGSLGTAPLSAALARQAMPESFLALWVALALWCGLSAQDFTRLRFCVGLGLALMMAGLTKQTMVLYLALPLLLLGGLALKRVGLRALVGLSLTVLLALPLPLLWLQLHWQEQVEYGTRSAEAKTTVPLWAELAYYPAGLVGEGLGLVWTPLFLLALGMLIRRRAWLPLLMWGLMLLAVLGVPKKYPRMLVPMMPLTAALLAVGVGCVEPRRLRQGLVLGGLGLGTLQHLTLSFSLPLPDKLGIWTPGLYHELDPDCAQEWIRRAQAEDPAFEGILSLYRESESVLGSEVLLVREPPVPCRYETTFGYAFHFSDFMRRHRHELSDVAVGEVNPDDFERQLPHARVVVSTRPWCDAQAGTQEEVGCGLRGAFVEAGVLEGRLGPAGATPEDLQFKLYLYRRVVPVERTP
ncbi:MAG: ArnT family glycosyltransferase [Myxococcota bacterium]